MRRGLRTLGLIAILTLVTSLLGVGSASAGEDETDPTAGAPTVGDCFDATNKQAWSYSVSGESVDCRRDHTIVVTAVGNLPASYEWGYEDRLSPSIMRSCNAGEKRLIGRSPTLRFRSQYQLFFFGPTRSQYDSGARWYMCAIGAFDDSRIGGVVVDLPNPLPKLTRHLPDSVSRCVTRKLAYTTCADRHDWRMSYSVLVHQRLTEKNLDRAANRSCPAHVSSEAWLRSGEAVTSPSGRSVRKRSFVLGCLTKTHR